MTYPVRVVLWGIGALGHLVAQAAADDPRVTVVGAIDHAPDKAGRELAAVAETKRSGEVVISPDLASCLQGLPEPPDVIFHMTESAVSAITPQLQMALERRINVISAAESMFYPELRYPAMAALLDRTAQDHGVTITGTGVNPGFVFDSLVLATATASTEITSIELNRVVEVAGTGPCDIDHTGFGLWPDDFQTKLAAGTVVGHMGMAESVAILAERLDLPIDSFQEAWTPVTSTKPVASSIGLLEPGRVTGIVQTGTAYHEARPVITARLAMYYDASSHEAEVDEITIHGSHTIHLRLEPSAVSILSAALLMLNTAPAVVAASPGLVTVVDLPVAATRRGRFHLRLADSDGGVGRLRFVTAPVEA